MWFDEGLQVLKVYASGGLPGISGLSAETSSKTYRVGDCCGAPTSTITLQPPQEVLTDIDVRVFKVYPFALTVSLMLLSGADAMLLTLVKVQN